jgi:oligosaccharide:H+ symporter
MTGSKVKLLYLFIYMGFATWRVFYNVYLDTNGFTGAEIGIINALLQGSIIFIVPVWGFLADKKGIRPSLRIALFMSAMLILFLGKVLDFYAVLAYMFLLTLFHHPLGPLTDALSVQLGKSDPKRFNYGNLRLWGSLGWAISSVTAGYLFNYIRLERIFPITALFFLIAIGFLGIPLFRKPVNVFRPEFTPIRINDILSNRPLFGFIVLLIIYGVVCSPVNAYLNLYFTELGADNSQVGLAYTIQSLSELPFFLIGNFLVKKFGPKRVILLSILVMVFRMFAYGMKPNIILALFIGAFQGISLSFFLVGVVEYIHSQLPHGRDATAQSLIWGLYFGVGHTFGNLITGYLKDLLGMQGVMATFAWGTLLVFLLSASYFYMTARIRST